MPIFAFVFIFLFQPNFANASNEVGVYFFWGDGCPHCAKEEIFLNGLEKSYPDVSVYDFEVWENANNRKLLTEVGKKLNADISGVPFTVIGDKIFVGYGEGLTSKEVENRVKYCSVNLCPDSVAEIVGLTNGENTEIVVVENENITEEKSIKVPIFGNINISKLSLPILTIVLGALDGFNPCAMWTLLFLISLLLGMENKKRMWILGSVFIIASAAVYFMFMAAWLNLILFLGLVIWLRAIIALVALAGGGYNLYEYFTKPVASCEITSTEKRQKVFEKLKDITHRKNFYLALGGIIVLAFAVNLVELFCSAGLPAIYTQILALNNLPSWQYYLYLLLYIFIFMLDDLIVFFIAMITLKMTGITTKYSRASHLIGGILMLIIGLLLILRPEWLMFG